MPEGKQNILWLSKYFLKHDDDNADKLAFYLRLHTTNNLIWIKK